MPRPKEPIELLTYKGNKNLTKKEIEERKAQEIKAPSDNVKPPMYLPRDLKREFKKIAIELVDLGIMSNLDVDALARYLISRKLYLEVTDKLFVIGSTTVDMDEEGNEVHVANNEYSSLLINQDKLFKQCRSAASDLGLTITSRCKLVVPKEKDDQPKNKFSKFAR